MPEQSAPPPEPKPSRSIRHILVPFGIAGSLLFAAWFAMVWANNEASSIVNRRRERGECITVADVEAKRPRMPDELNAAALVLSLSDEILAVSAAKHALEDSKPEGGNAPAPPQVEGQGDAEDPVEAYEHARAALRAKLDALEGRPHGFAPLPKPGSGVPVAAVCLPIHWAFSMVTVDALTALVQRDGEDKTRHLNLLLSLVGALDSYPSALDQVQNAWQRELLVQLIELALETSIVDTETLIDWQERLTFFAEDDSLYWAMVGERALLYNNYDAQAAAKAIPVSSWQDPSTGPRSAVGKLVIRRQQILSVRYLTRYIDALDDPPRALEIAKQLNQEVVKLPGSVRVAQAALGAV
jgi:hypothetical protein